MWTARAAARPTGISIDARGSVTVGDEGGVVAVGDHGDLQWGVVVDGAPVRRPPVLAGNVVAVLGTYQMVGLDRATGAVRWTAGLPDARAAAADAGDTILVASGAEIALLDAPSGAARWTTPLPTPGPDAAPYVYVSGGTGLVAWGRPGDCCNLLGIEITDGRELWHAKVSSASTVPVVSHGSVFLAENTGPRFAAARARRLDVRSGQPEWSTPIEGDYMPLLHADAEGRDVVFVDRSGSLTLLDASSGRVRWRSEDLYRQDDTAPVLAGDRVFYAAYETVFVGLDRRTGDVLGKGPPEPPVFVRQLVARGERLQMLVTTNGLGAIWNLEQAS
jgi:outer membrane protein assembly factor BamB